MEAELLAPAMAVIDHGARVPLPIEQGTAELLRSLHRFNELLSLINKLLPNGFARGSVERCRHILLNDSVAFALGLLRENDAFSLSASFSALCIEAERRAAPNAQNNIRAVYSSAHPSASALVTKVSPPGPYPEDEGYTEEDVASERARLVRSSLVDWLKPTSKQEDNSDPEPRQELPQGRYLAP